MQLIGSVVRLQVQLSSLKLGERPWRWYDPAPLRGVPRLAIDQSGVVGWTAEGDRMDDVHHLAHPDSKNRGGNGVSVGFTSHYGAMRRRFGTHLVDGIAGENVLIATGLAGGLAFSAGELDGAALVVETDGGPVRLERLSVAEPCVEFSRFALGDGAADAESHALKAALDFLRRGMRGYYTVCQRSGVVELGDMVYLQK